MKRIAVFAALFMGIHFGSLAAPLEETTQTAEASVNSHNVAQASHRINDDYMALVEPVTHVIVCGNIDMGYVIWQDDDELFEIFEYWSEQNGC